MTRPDIRIEFPMSGATYHEAKYGVYAYDVYERHSVLAGQQRRTFLDCYDTLEDAQRAHPEAIESAGCGYMPPSLHHLPDEDDGDYLDNDFDRDDY